MTMVGAESHPRRSVLVTGGSAGVGLAVARHLAAAGHRVAIAARDTERLERALALLGGDAIAVAMDAADEASIRAGIDELARRGLVPNILVNNAGLMGNAVPAGPALDRELRRSMDANLFGPALISSLLSPGMVERGWGRIVNVASTAGLAAPPRQLPYSVSKAALIALTRGLAVELGGTGVTVNAVAPGPVATESYVATKGRDAMARRARSIPGGRLATAADVAGTIAFLVREDAAHVSGQVVAIDGGEAAAGPYAAMLV